MAQERVEQTPRPRLLFVDDEQRVLNSMRIMFRRQFELFLASDGSEALDIIKQRDIDVIVADHRMPQMTGVEVLSRVRSLSPRTVRILLTGYADLDAVEGSINEGEVFRFLTKPCAPHQLKETIELAAKLAREVPLPADDAPDDADALSGEAVMEIIMENDTATLVEGDSAVSPAADAGPLRDFTGTDVIERPPQIVAPSAAASTPTAASESASGAATASASETATAPDGSAAGARRAAGLGVVLFSSDEAVVTAVQQAVRGRLPVYTASNIVKVVSIITEHRPGVLVTDISSDKATIQAMTARLKEHLPELVTIAISQHRDVLDMVWLINHGQIFRFLRKPLSVGRCAVSLQAALQHHRALLKNPELVKRHAVATSEDTSFVDGMLSKLKNVKRLWASA